MRKAFQGSIPKLKLLLSGNPVDSFLTRLPNAFLIHANTTTQQLLASHSQTSVTQSVVERQRVF